jgi:broad specificity phosphatase PhoE
MTPAPTIVYFVRHGQTAANAGSIIQGHTDVPLDETGLKQADIVAKRLSNTHFDVIYSSDLSRALVTAKKISGSREVITTPQLREWHLGHWQGRSLDEIKSIFQDEHRRYLADDPEFTVADGESSREFKERVISFMQEIAAKHPRQTILCVSHGGFLTKVFKYVLQVETLPRRPRIFNTALCCFSTVDCGKTWQLVTWNDASHLQNGALDDV